MKLFYSPGACSLSPHIVLEELRLPYQPEKVDLRTHRTADGGDYYAINPKGYVPALQLDDGKVLTEGPAIVQYLAEQKPEAKLAPASGSFEHYQLQEWLNFIATEIHKTLGPLFHPMSAEAREAILTKVANRFEYLGRQLGSRQYLMGDNFSVADAYLFAILRWTPRFHIDLAKWPVLKAFYDRVAARPAVQTTLKAEGISA